MEAQRQRAQELIQARQELYASTTGSPCGEGEPPFRRRPGGGMGMGLPLLGGIATGMILGDFGGGIF